MNADSKKIKDARVTYSNNDLLPLFVEAIEEIMKLKKELATANIKLDMANYNLNC